MLSVMISNSSLIINNESWFLPIDILTNICIIIGLIFAIIFFFIILYDRTCYTVPMLLVGNSCFIGIFFGILILSMSFFRLFNDIHIRIYQDLTCSFRGYFGYATCSILNFSYFLQAIYRYIRVVYPNRLFYQSAKFQMFLIVLIWIFGIFYPIHFLFTNEILYDIRNQICQLRLYLSFSIIYMASFAYIIPVLLTFIIYVKLVFYVKNMNQHIAPVNILSRARKELRMLQRTIILVSILIINCLPYATFIFLSFFIQIPIYHFRISFVFIDISYLLVIVLLFQFTDPLKTAIKNKFFQQQNNIVPIIK